MESQEKSYTLTVKEASEIIGVNKRTLYRWVKSGKLSHITVAVGNTEQIRLNEEEIRAISSDMSQTSSDSISQTITLRREEYNQLIFRLGVLEAERQRRLELEEQAQSLREEKSQLQQEHEELQEEYEKLKAELARSWWERFKSWWKGGKGKVKR